MHGCFVYVCLCQQHHQSARGLGICRWVQSARVLLVVYYGLSELYFTQFRIQTKLYANEKVPNLRIDDFQPSPLLLIFSIIVLNFRIALVRYIFPTSRYRRSVLISCHRRYSTSRDENIKNRSKRKKNSTM